MKLVRSNLPPHQQVFYTQANYNKFDIKQYLTKLYNIEIKDIRTMNYARMKKNSPRGDKVIPKYKKVIVTMDNDFLFPREPSVKEDGCVRIPPRVVYGKGSAKKVIRKIQEQALEREIPLDQKV
jgi:ribosomal protein L23